jgi:hypothetical protein
MARPVRQQQAGQQLLRVLLGNGHQTSGGTGPGVVEVPLAEASAIVAHHHGRILADGEQPGDLAARQARGVSN